MKSKITDKAINGKRLISLKDIADSIKEMGSYGFVMECEEQYHNKIVNAVYDIAQGISSKRVILLAGPSGSGKTTTANRIKNQLENFNIPTLRISMDDYFLSLDERPKNIESFEDPKCVDWDLLMKQLGDLLNGKKVRLPKYNFIRGISEYGPTLEIPSDGIIICEGIHALNSELFNELRGFCKGIYAAPRTRIGNEHGDILQPQQLRLARRMLRDSRTRGRDINTIIEQAKSVDAGETKYINPFKEKASIHLDTSLDYELCVIARCLVESKSLNDVDDNAVLMQFIRDIQKTIPEKCVPKDSILREFIG